MRSGFSLLETLVVIALVALFAMMALPRFTGVIARAKRSEALSHLKALWMAEMDYHARNGTYTDRLMDAQGLGWKMHGTPLYTYGFPGQDGMNYVTGSSKAPSSALTGARVSADGFVIAAAADLQGNGVYDVVTIDQDGKINVVNDATK